MLKQSILLLLLCVVCSCTTGNNTIVISSGNKTTLHRYAEFGRIDKITGEYNPDDPIEPGDENGYTPLMIVATASFASEQHIATFNYLIKHGAHINTVNETNHNNTFHLAALNPHVLNSYNYTMLEHILNSGVNINATNNQGQTPLIIALNTYKEIRHSQDLIKRWFVFFNWLLKNKADLKIKDSSNNTPLSIARTYKNEELIKVIQNHTK